MERLKNALAAGALCVAQLWLAGCVQQDVVPDAVLLANQGEEKKAIALLEGYLREHPNATRERRLALRMHASSGDLAAAERHAAELGRVLGARSPVPWIELGHAMELRHRYDEALALYDKAADVAREDPTGPQVGGLRAAHWGEFDLAAERLTEALRRDPRSAATWHALGFAELNRGDPKSAEKAYRSGLIADPASAENHLGLATLAIQAKAYGSALQHYDAVVELRPRFANAHLGRSWALLLLGRLQQAKAALLRAQSLGADPRATRAQFRALQELEALSKSQRNAQKPQQNR